MTTVSVQSSEWLIRNGLCFALFSFDAAQRQTIHHKRRAPSYFEYQPPPLRISEQSEPGNFGRFSARADVDLLIYDFGAVAVIYSFPIAGRFVDLLQLSEELYDNESLLSDSRLRVNELLKVIGDAAVQASLAPVVEDYVIFHIESFTEPFDAKQFCS